MTAEQLTPATLDTLLATGGITYQTVCAEPVCRLRVDPDTATLTLETPVDGTHPDITQMSRVTADEVEREDGTWARLIVPARELRYEAYGLLVAVIEAMRGGATFAAATNAAVANLRMLIAARSRLSEEQQIGLIGELLAVRSLLGSHSPPNVLHWWLGPLAEQHDFSLPGYDAEIKTTLSERRKHRISGTGQLTPTPGRALWLVSIQLTRGTGGVTLPGLVHEVRGLAHRDHRLDAYLGDVGWRDEDSDLYDTSYLLRTASAAYLVDDQFPAVTADSLHAVVPRDDLVDMVSYRVDVTDLAAGRPGGPLTLLLSEGTL